jgi:hypothetical protein
MKPYTINNYISLIFFSNNDTPLKITHKERRFCVYDCNNDYACDKEYFRKLYKCLTDEKTMYILYSNLMKEDLSTFDIEKDIPKTKYYKELQSTNIPIIARFLNDIIYNPNEINELVDENLTIKSITLFKRFQKWVIDTNFDCKYNITKFGKEINMYMDKKRFKTGILYMYDIQKITKELNEYDFDKIEDI